MLLLHIIQAATDSVRPPQEAISGGVKTLLMMWPVCGVGGTRWWITGMEEANQEQVTTFLPATMCHHSLVIWFKCWLILCEVGGVQRPNQPVTTAAADFSLLTFRAGKTNLITPSLKFRAFDFLFLDLGKY